MSVYPSGTDSFIPPIGGQTEVASSDITSLQTAVAAIQNSIGLTGSFVYSSGNIYANSYSQKDSFDISDIKLSGSSSVAGFYGTKDFQLSKTPVSVPSFSVIRYTDQPATFSNVTSSWMYVDSSGNLMSSFGRASQYYNINTQNFTQSKIADYTNSAITMTKAMFKNKNPSTNILYLATSSRIFALDTVDNGLSLLAGNGSTVTSGNGIPATGAAINVNLNPQLIEDNVGNLYFTDVGGYIRKIDIVSGTITNIAGNGVIASQSGDGGPATGAALGNVVGIASHPATNEIYIVSNGTNMCKIRKVDVSGNISTVAFTGTQGFSGDGGQATLAAFNPSGRCDISIDESGQMYIPAQNNLRLRIVNTSGIISTIAGNGTGPGLNVATNNGHNVIATGPTLGSVSLACYSSGVVFMSNGSIPTFLSGTNTYNISSNVAISNIGMAYPITPLSGNINTAVYSTAAVAYVPTINNTWPSSAHEQSLVANNVGYLSEPNFAVYWSGTKDCRFIYDFDSTTTPPSGLVVRYFTNEL